MAIVSLILGVIGTVSGVGALVWNVLIWRRSGPVITIAGTGTRQVRVSP